jgi:hypothetical protein
MLKSKRAYWLPEADSKLGVTLQELLKAVSPLTVPREYPGMESPEKSFW